MEKYLTANGLKLAYDEFGYTDKPAIILVMGLGTQMIAWPEDFCEQLASKGFRVIRYDNRDIGLSEKIQSSIKPNLLLILLFAQLRLPFKVPYKLTDMANDAIGLMDTLDIKKAHIVGASMGGMIAQLVTALYPDRILSLTSIMSTSGSRQVPSARRSIVRLMLRKPANTDEDIIQQRIELYRAMGSVGELAYSTDVLYEKVSRSYNRSYYPEGFVRHLAAVAHNGSRVSLLKKIRQPTLVLHGKADPLVPVEGGIDTARHIPNAKLLLFDNMGHDLPSGLMSEFAELIGVHAQAAT